MSQRHAGFVPGQHPIEAYGNGGFRFAGMSHRGSILVLPSGIYALAADGASGLDPEALARLFAEPAAIDLVLVGTGTELVALPEPTGWLFRDKGLSVEPMPTGAAARTYNILLAEQRRVAAALIAVA
jgi:uncharacterized protein